MAGRPATGWWLAASWTRIARSGEAKLRADQPSEALLFPCMTTSDEGCNHQYNGVLGLAGPVQGMQVRAGWLSAHVINGPLSAAKWLGQSWETGLSRGAERGGAGGRWEGQARLGRLEEE